MSVSVQGNLHTNQLDAPPEFLERQAGKIVFRGAGSRVRIGAGCTAEQLHLTVGSDCQVTIGPDCGLKALSINVAHAGEVTIGRGTHFTWYTALHAHEPCKLIIGEGCMFASDTWVSVSDLHSVVEVKSRRRLNYGGDVRIADRVWIGERAMILKKVSVGAGSIIAAAATVTRDVPAECMAAGSPARVVRRGVTWDHRLL